MKKFAKGFGVAFLGGALIIGVSPLLFSSSLVENSSALLSSVVPERKPRQKTPEELIAEARARSSDIRALYMTADVASDPGAGAARLRDAIIDIAEHTEINAIVMDVKEVCGPDYDEENLKKLLDELKAKNIWAIARIVAFKDASQIKAHPEWYLTRASPKAVREGGCKGKQHLVAKGAGAEASRIFWRDNTGGYWLDPASSPARAYLITLSKHMIDMGFDELQFDYVRFPSDGDVSQALYPTWDRATPRYDVMRSFFVELRDSLKAYKPDIILSADIFGYVAAQHEDPTIGQRLSDIVRTFDYVSFMVYPSHYYSGLYLAANPARGLPAISYTVAEARANPDVTVGRSLIVAQDYFDLVASTSRATTSPESAQTIARIRPWLEDFFHEADRLAGRPWGAQKVRLQIDAAQDSTGHGWMLWNAANVYTKGALKEE
ncbi:MAG: hypothetical protein HYT41_01470 [Candidatus Sungbacteria bacterium]|nr:hypothetical protein [Candidatus Sungbacteria bacterium]